MADWSLLQRRPVIGLRLKPEHSSRLWRRRGLQSSDLGPQAACRFGTKGQMNAGTDLMGSEPILAIVSTRPTHSAIEKVDSEANAVWKKPFHTVFYVAAEAN